MTGRGYLKARRDATGRGGAGRVLARQGWARLPRG